MHRVGTSGLLRRRARTAVAGITAALVLALAACGSDDDKDATNAGASNDASASAPAAADAAAYPVTITHKLGTTTIKEAPKRIVALGEGDQDAALALGVQLVGMVETTPVTPWAEPKITGDKPELITMNEETGAPVEKVLALKPDLILASTDYWIEGYYDKLSKIAPTTAFEVGPSQDSWQQVVLQVGKALGKPAEAQKLVADTDAKLANVKTQHPELVGKTFALTRSLDTSSVLVLKDREDISVKLLLSFGMILPDNLASLPSEGFAAQLSLERLDLLEVNVLLSGYADAGVQKGIEENPQFAKLNVVKRGSYLLLDANDFWALRNATVLSIDYIIEKLVPRISEAAKAGA